jgi:uncharacterized membrane protein YkoI
MMRFVAVAALAVALASTAGATTTSKHSKPLHPKVSLETAKATAQAKVPDGKLLSHELEKEHGRTIYSFEFKVQGKSGVEEVNVDAMTGKVVGVEHESPKNEQHENKKDPSHSG